MTRKADKVEIQMDTDQTQNEIAALRVSQSENPFYADTAWKRLVRKYANGRVQCNCGQAYYTPCGHGIRADGTERHDLLACQSGCSSNQITARDEIAQWIEAENG